VGKTERVTDGHHPIAGLHLARITKLRFGQRPIRFFDQLDQRAVGQRVAADDFRFVFLVLFVELDGDLAGAFDDVIIGNDEAVFVDDESRPAAWVTRGCWRRCICPRGDWPPCCPGAPKNRSSRSSLPKNSLRSCVRCRDSVRMLTTIGDCDFAMLRNVVASTGPASGALLVAGIANVCAEDTGDRSEAGSDDHADHQRCHGDEDDVENRRFTCR
jgi:hypothetical protein